MVHLQPRKSFAKYELILRKRVDFANFGKYNKNVFSISERKNFHIENRHIIFYAYLLSVINKDLKKK